MEEWEASEECPVYILILFLRESICFLFALRMSEWLSEDIIFKRIVLVLLSGHVIVYRNAFKASFIKMREGREG